MKPKEINKASKLKKPVYCLRYMVALLTVMLTFALFSPSWSQEYQKGNKRFYKAYYRKQIVLFANACNILERKHNKPPKRSYFASNHKARPRTASEVTSSPMLAQNTDTKPVNKPLPKPAPTPTPTPAPAPAVANAGDKPLPKTPKIEHISSERLAELHKKQEEVLASNNIPLPTSEKHAAVRKMVADKLAAKTNVYPLVLAPLYFNFNQDEFSVVDMEPFLIAAEYALQGRTVLIEGHTDSRGADDFNVKLSIKRVQKIRQLMRDMGVPDDRISVIGYGEELKTNSNKTSEGRQRNRRVDFTIF